VSEGLRDLRAELSGAREVLSEYDKIVDALRAENERLREALEKARDELREHGIDEPADEADAALKAAPQ
jgi:regulator of replication initiation timing